MRSACGVQLAVRRVTLGEFTALFRAHCARCLEGKDGYDFLAWVPSRILTCCYDKEIKEFK